MPAGQTVPPLRSNIPAIGEYDCYQVDPSCVRSHRAGPRVVDRRDICVKLAL